MRQPCGFDNPGEFPGQAIRVNGLSQLTAQYIVSGYLYTVVLPRNLSLSSMM